MISFLHILAMQDASTIRIEFTIQNCKIEMFSHKIYILIYFCQICLLHLPSTLKFHMTRLRIIHFDISRTKCVLDDIKVPTFFSKPLQNQVFIKVKTTESKNIRSYKILLIQFQQFSTKTVANHQTRSNC